MEDDNIRLANDIDICEDENNILCCDYKRYEKNTYR